MSNKFGVRISSAVGINTMTVLYDKLFNIEQDRDLFLKGISVIIKCIRTKLYEIDPLAEVTFNFELYTENVTRITERVFTKI